MRKHSFILPLATLIFTSTSIHAQVIPAFRNIDKDRDGFIGSLEAKASGNTTLKKYFKKLDLNKDEKVDAKEFAKLKTAVAAENKKKRAAREAAKRKQLERLRQQQRRNRMRRRRR